MKFVDIRDEKGTLRFSVSKELGTQLVSELNGKWVEKSFKKTGKTMVFVFDTYQLVTISYGSGFFKQQAGIAGIIFHGDYINLNQE